MKDAVPAGGTLVGLEVNVVKLPSGPAIKSARAVFLVGEKESYGEWRGPAADANAEKVRLVAKPGYAVGAISARHLPFLFGLSVTFMKVKDGKLDPTDKYESDWAGAKDGLGQGPTTVGGKGELALGLILKSNPLCLSGIGLSYGDGAKNDPVGAAPTPVAASPKGGVVAPVIAGGKTDPEFRDPIPAGGALVGLEVGLGKNGPNTVVKAARAVFRAGDKETSGEWHGPTGADVVTEKVRVVAKTGYTVGGLSARTGGAGIFGLSVTFMKYTDGKLDPKDSYESDWVGAAIGLGPVVVGGKGEPVHGFAGKTNATALTGVGLLFQDATKKPPETGGPPAVGSVPMPPIPPMPAMPPAPVPVPVRPDGRGPRIAGGPFDAEFRDHAPPDGLLVGFHVGLGKFVTNDVVKAIRPIYRVGEKDSNGLPFGTSAAVSKILAKPGYAVGAVTIKNGLGIDGLSVTFMKIVDGKLDPTDKYESEWVGGKGGGPETTLGGDGVAVVGVLLKANAKEVTGLGLVYTDTNKPGLDGPWPAGKPTKMLGGGDTEFREAGPAGSLLVGFEVGVGRFVDNPIVAGFRPIFRADGKDTEGEWHGGIKVPDNVREFVKVVAKPGYAVGAITAKAGLGIDGFSVTFMKVKGAKLDPTDKYESEWVGGKGGGPEMRIGDGTPVIGVTGKGKPDWTTGIGLLNPPDKK